MTPPPEFFPLIAAGIAFYSAVRAARKGAPSWVPIGLLGLGAIAFAAGAAVFGSGPGFVPQDNGYPVVVDYPGPPIAAVVVASIIYYIVGLLLVARGKA